MEQASNPPSGAAGSQAHPSHQRREAAERSMSALLHFPEVAGPAPKVWDVPSAEIGRPGSSNLRSL
jgi:hypothetical protein